MFKVQTKMVRLSYELSVVSDHNPIINWPWLSMSFSKPACASLRRDGGNSAPLRCAVAHSKIVLQMPESLECCAVPFRQAGLGFIGCLEEIEENIVR